jgi:hypothetical protein
MSTGARGEGLKANPFLKFRKKDPPKILGENFDANLSDPCDYQ